MAHAPIRGPTVSMEFIEGNYRTLLVERPGDGIVLCRFNRPDVRNALNQTMVDDVRAFLQALLVEIEELRCVVFTGAGEKSFISGADIAELRERKRSDALRRINNTLLREIEQFPLPTIAAVRGYALGGGCEMAMACDLRVAGEGAKFGQPEAGLGILPGAGATYRLPKLVGLGRAKELILTGRIIDAGEALEIGLVNKVVPDEEVVESALRMAGEVATKSALALRFAKAALNSSTEWSTDAGMAFEATAQAVLFEDPDKDRRMTEFLEKKK